MKKLSMSIVLPISSCFEPIIVPSDARDLRIGYVQYICPQNGRVIDTTRSRLDAVFAVHHDGKVLPTLQIFPAFAADVDRHGLIRLITDFCEADRDQLTTFFISIIADMLASHGYRVAIVVIDEIARGILDTNRLGRQNAFKLHGIADNTIEYRKELLLMERILDVVHQTIFGVVGRLSEGGLYCSAHNMDDWTSLIDPKPDIVQNMERWQFTFLRESLQIARKVCAITEIDNVHGSLIAKFDDARFVCEMAELLGLQFVENEPYVFVQGAHPDAELVPHVQNRGGKAIIVDHLKKCFGEYIIESGRLVFRPNFPMIHKLADTFLKAAYEKGYLRRLIL